MFIKVAVVRKMLLWAALWTFWTLFWMCWGKQSAKVSLLLLVVKIEQKLVNSILVVDTLPGSSQMLSPLWATSGSTIREIQGCSRWKIWMPTQCQLELLTFKLSLAFFEERHINLKFPTQIHKDQISLWIFLIFLKSLDYLSSPQHNASARLLSPVGQFPQQIWVDAHQGLPPSA